MLRYLLCLAMLAPNCIATAKALEIKAGVLYGLPSSGEANEGLAGNDTSEYLKIGANGHNKDFGMGVEFTSRNLSVVKATDANSSLAPGELQYTILAIPFYFTAYFPVESRWFRPGLELSASYLLINKPKMEQDIAFGLAPMIKFVLGKHLDLLVEARYLQRLGSTGSAGSSLLDLGSWSFGPGIAFIF
jgi:hypothetical protein